MGGFLKQSTAAVIPFGPFLDKTDGVTLEVAAGIITSIDHATTGIFVSKNGGAGAIRHQNVTASTLDAYGMFLVTLDTTDTNTIGRLRVMMAEAATFLPVWDDFTVLPGTLWDTLFVAQPCAAINKFFDKATPTGTVNSLPDAVPGANNGIPTTNGTKVNQTVDLTASQEIAADLTKIHGTAITETATQLAGAFTKFFDVATPTGTVNSIPDAVAGAAGGIAIVGSEMVVPNTQKVDVETIKTQAVTCAAGVTVGVYVGGASAHALASEVTAARMGALTDWINGGRLDLILDIIAADTTTDIPGTITTMQGNITTIMADTDLLDDAVGGLVDIHTDVAAVKSETAELKAAVITNAAGVDIAADIIAIKAETATIVADTNELQVDDTPAAIAALDAVVDTVKVDTAANKVILDALTAAAATKLALSAGTIVAAAAAAGTLSTTQMTTDLTEATNDHYNGRIIIWTSGVLQNQATDITDYDGATKMLTYTAVTTAPTAADIFIIV